MISEFSRSGTPGLINSVADVGAVIRATRQQYGLSQSQLAGLAGTGLRFISELERGKPSIQLAKALDVIATLGLQLQIGPGQP